MLKMFLGKRLGPNIVNLEMHCCRIAAAQKKLVPVKFHSVYLQNLCVRREDNNNNTKFQEFKSLQ